MERDPALISMFSFLPPSSPHSSIQMPCGGIMPFTTGFPQEIYLRSVRFNRGCETLIGNPVTNFIEHLLCALSNSSLSSPSKPGM